MKKTRVNLGPLKLQGAIKETKAHKAGAKKNTIQKTKTYFFFKNQQKKIFVCLDISGSKVKFLED